MVARAVEVHSVATPAHAAINKLRQRTLRPTPNLLFTIMLPKAACVLCDVRPSLGAHKFRLSHRQCYGRVKDSRAIDASLAIVHGTVNSANAAKKLGFSEHLSHIDRLETFKIAA